VSEKFGSTVHVLVNNAAAFIFHSVETASAEDWDYSAAINIKGHALLTKHLLPLLKVCEIATYLGSSFPPLHPSLLCFTHVQNANGASIVFQGSISSYLAQPNCATYATMKGAIVQMVSLLPFTLPRNHLF
jgi:NAD(P)-dependent dehydrogenase (short-subunit alcohol dehydrogenase family)